MTEKRWLELMNDPNGKLTKEEMEEGWHWCYSEFDGLLVGPGMFEMDICTCFKREDSDASTS